MTTQSHAGVILMTYGSPGTLDDIPVYLKHVYGGREATTEVIAEFRRRYALIGGSPLVRITREQAAALAGIAPYDDDSGEQVGVRHIDGGRERLRRALYTAALPASFRWNKQLIALYRRLIAAGKGHKRALIACARKLLIFANTVVARGTPWQHEQPPITATPGA